MTDVILGLNLFNIKKDHAVKISVSPILYNSHHIEDCWHSEVQLFFCTRVVGEEHDADVLLNRLGFPFRYATNHFIAHVQCNLFPARYLEIKVNDDMKLSDCFSSPHYFYSYILLAKNC